MIFHSSLIRVQVYLAHAPGTSNVSEASAGCAQKQQIVPHALGF